MKLWVTPKGETSEREKGAGDRPMGCSHNKGGGGREGNSETLGEGDTGTHGGAGGSEKQGSQWCQMLQSGQEKEGRTRALGSWGGGLSLISGEQKRQSQRMVWLGTRFKTGLQSVSYGFALFTLIILYQVGVTSCSVWETVGERGCGDGQVVA